MSRYTTGGMAAYVQKACHCRPHWMCPFCRRWLKPGKPNPTAPIGVSSLSGPSRGHYGPSGLTHTPKEKPE